MVFLGKLTSHAINSITNSYVITTMSPNPLFPDDVKSPSKSDKLKLEMLLEISAKVC